MISIYHCKQKAFVTMLLVVSMSLIGCAATMKVPVDRQIELTEGATTQGSYKAGQVSVAYTFNRTGDNMLLDGTVSHYGGFDSLDVRVLFSDADGQVLQRNLVYSTGYRSGRAYKDGGNFEEKLKVPSGAVGFTFSYSSQPRRSSR
jgi:peptidoglycan hydrolase-like protein with peptidoglycan-binding domain